MDKVTIGFMILGVLIVLIAYIFSRYLPISFEDK